MRRLLCFFGFHDARFRGMVSSHTACAQCARCGAYWLEQWRDA